MFLRAFFEKKSAIDIENDAKKREKLSDIALKEALDTLDKASKAPKGLVPIPSYSLDDPQFVEGISGLIENECLMFLLWNMREQVIHSLHDENGEKLNYKCGLINMVDMIYTELQEYSNKWATITSQAEKGHNYNGEIQFLREEK